MRGVKCSREATLACRSRHASPKHKREKRNHAHALPCSMCGPTSIRMPPADKRQRRFTTLRCSTRRGSGTALAIRNIGSDFTSDRTNIGFPGARCSRRRRDQAPPAFVVSSARAYLVPGASFMALPVRLLSASSAFAFGMFVEPPVVPG